MDPKEIKSELKAAKECIKNKEFKEALKHCKAVLKHDKSHYNALVFVGVAAEGLEQPDQALAAYKKAVEADAGQPLAWQGLCSFYEKQKLAIYNEDLATVYSKLLEFNKSDAVKRYDLTLKLGALLEKLGKQLEAADLYHRITESSSNEGQTAVLWQKIFHNLQSQRALSQEHQQLLTKALEHLIAYSHILDQTEMEDIWKAYIQDTIKNSNDSALITKRCCEMKEKFNQSAYPEEILCQINLEQCLVDGKENTSPSSHADNLRSLNQSSLIIPLINGYLAVTEGKIADAHQLLSQSREECKNLACYSLLQACILQKLHDREGVCSSVTRGMKLLEQPTSYMVMDSKKAGVQLLLLKLRSLAKAKEDSTLSEALDLVGELKKSLPDNVEVLALQGQILLSLKNTEEAKKVYEKASTLDPAASLVNLLQGQIALAEQEHAVAEHWIVKAAEADGASANCLFWLGRVYWQKAKTDSDARQKCYNAFLKSAKLDPYNSDSFLYLGYYYQQIQRDINKASKCYKKAFDLDVTNEEAGCAYVDALMATQNEDVAAALMSQVTQEASAGSVKWAWMRLGLCQLKQEDPTVAIASFQSALRADPNDRNCWECLAEAYLTRGSYTAALKAFTRATELDPQAMYSFYQIASIKQTLGQFAEAVEDYKTILEKTPDYVPALKGLGETYYLLARGSIEKCFHGRAVDQCAVAMDVLTRAASSRPDLSCLWKLLGDACTILHPLPEQLVSVQIPAKLLKEEGSDGEAKITVDKEKLLAVGSRCYGMALKLLPDCSSLWHDLGVNYYHQSQLLGGTGGQILAAKAVQVLQKALSLDPNNFKHWNALGNIASSKEVNNLALAQHCFIKSIKAEANNVVAWTNLGTLYYLNSQLELAHEAFKTAQSLEPSYVASWIGQALIAETVGSEEAMDLFRHTTELANHIEGAVGYAQWVCSTVLDSSKMDSDFYKYAIDQMAAVPAASDALARYTDKVKDDATAYNMYGMLLERQGLHKPAADAFGRVVDLMEKGGDSDKIKQAKLNHARALSNSGNYEQSIQTYLSVEGDISFEEICGLGLTYYKAGQYEKSYEIYEKAIKMTEDDKKKSQAHAAMGMAAFKADNLEMAKSALFASSQTSTPCQQGLLALCGLGLLQSDQTLSSAVLQELHKMADGSAALVAQLEYLQAQLYALQGEKMAGKRHLAKFIHSQPLQAEVWENLGSYISCFLPQQSTAAYRSCQVAAKLQGAPLVKPKQELLRSVASLGAGLHACGDPSRKSMSLAQKAVHSNPGEMMNWCALLSAASAGHTVKMATCDQDNADHSFILGLAAQLLAKVEADLSQQRSERMQALHLWCVKQYITCLLAAGRIQQAKQFVSQAAWLYDNEDFLRAVAGKLEKNGHALKQLTKDSSANVYAWQVLALLYLGKGMVDETESVYKMCVQGLTKSGAWNQEKLVPLLNLAHLAYRQILYPDQFVSLGGGDEEKWSTLFEEAAGEISKLSPACPPLLLMQGILAIRNKKTERLGRRYLEMSLANSSNNMEQYAESLARRHLAVFYSSKGDSDNLQKIANEAAENGDKETLLLLDTLKDSS